MIIKTNQQDERRSDIRTVRPVVYCDYCGTVMVLRKPHPGGNIFEPFWGCRIWPDCDGTKIAFFDEAEQRYLAQEAYDPDWGFPGSLEGPDR